MAAYSTLPPFPDTACISCPSAQGPLISGEIESNEFCRVPSDRPYRHAALASYGIPATDVDDASSGTATHAVHGLAAWKLALSL